MSRLDYCNDEINLKVYGSLEPPVYCYQNICFDSELIWGGNDYGGGEEDCKVFAEKMVRGGSHRIWGVEGFEHSTWDAPNDYMKLWGIFGEIMKDT